MVEKIKVNLSYNTYNLLIKDMESFNFEKKDNKPNKNLFYNTIIKNMFARKQKEDNEIRDKLNAILSAHIKSEHLLNQLLDEMESIYNHRIEDKTNRSHGYYISFRPSKKIEDIYEIIENENLKNNTISAYFRNLFNEYAHLPQDEREAIIFADTLNIINKAISNKKTIKINFPNTSFEYKPYTIVKTADEQYNYLIGGTSTKKGELKFFSLHLYKLTNIYMTKNSFSFTGEDKIQIDKQLIYGPREINRREEKVIVSLTEKGISLFKKMYVNRPIPESINENTYTFNGGGENIFLYFSRFGKNANIISPLHMKNRMKNFHKEAYAAYDMIKI